MKLWRAMLAELIERASTRVIARLLAEPSGPMSGYSAPSLDPETAANESVELLTHEQVQDMLVEREAMRAHPPTEPAPPPDYVNEPLVGSIEWRARQSDVRRIKG